MKIIVSFLLLTIGIYAQSGNDQKIELPDFVITGKQNISFPVRYKIKPALNFEVEQITVKSSNSDLLLTQIDVSEPPEILPENNSMPDYLNGIVKLGAGIYTLPEGSMLLMANPGNFLLSGKLYGKNTTEYLDNAGYNISGLNILSEYNVSENGEFLPGLKFKIFGDYSRESYYFFASDSSDFKRKAEGGNVKFSVSNYLNENINYDFSYRRYITSINEINLKENQDDFSFYASGGVSGFTVKGKAVLSKLNFYNDTLNSALKLNEFYGSIVTDFIPELKLESGLSYYNSDAADRLKLFVEGVFNFGRGLSVFGRFNPKVYFSSNRNYLAENKYYFPALPTAMIINETSSIEAGVKFQYYTYIELNAGFKYKKFSSFPYFSNPNNTGFFDIENAGDVSRSSIWGNALFHPGPFGQLYAGLEYGKTALSDGNTVPYSPLLKCNFSYTYPFDIGLDAILDFKYLGSSFSNVQNTLSTPAVSYLDLKLLYHINTGLDFSVRFENLFNRKNYIYGLYEQKPVDIVAEIEYHW